MKLKFTNIINFFLLPKDIYSRLSDKGMWLYIGIVFVGIRDVVLSLVGSSFEDPDFSSKFHLDLKTSAILLAAILIIGLLDVISFSYPIFDIVKHFKKKKENASAMTLGAAYSSFLTKVMKIYILANIVVTVIDIVYYVTGYIGVLQESLIFMYIASVLGILSYFWFNGVITRGLCVLFKIPSSVRGLIFVLVFLWNALLSSAIGYLMDQVIMRI
jgi:hypothetical protein